MEYHSHVGQELGGLGAGDTFCDFNHLYASQGHLPRRGRRLGCGWIMHGCVSERGDAGGRKADELLNNLEIHVATCYQVAADDANPKWVSRSYLSSVAGPLHFGLGQVESVEHVDVVWPDGVRERFAVERMDRVVELSRGAGSR